MSIKKQEAVYIWLLRLKRDPFPKYLTSRNFLLAHVIEPINLNDHYAENSSLHYTEFSLYRNLIIPNYTKLPVMLKNFSHYIEWSLGWIQYNGRLITGILWLFFGIVSIQNNAHIDLLLDLRSHQLIVSYSFFHYLYYVW